MTHQLIQRDTGTEYPSNHYSFSPIPIISHKQVCPPLDFYTRTTPITTNCSTAIVSTNSAVLFNGVYHLSDKRNRETFFCCYVNGCFRAVNHEETGEACSERGLCVWRCVEDVQARRKGAMTDRGIGMSRQMWYHLQKCRWWDESL